MKAAVVMLCSEVILTRLLLPRLALACSCMVAHLFSTRTYSLPVQKGDQRPGRDLVVIEMSQKTCSAREVKSSPRRVAAVEEIIFNSF